MGKSSRREGPRCERLANSNSLAKLLHPPHSLFPRFLSSLMSHRGAEDGGIGSRGREMEAESGLVKGP